MIAKTVDAMTAEHVEHGVARLMEPWTVGGQFASQAPAVEFKLPKLPASSLKTISKIHNQEAN